MAAIRRPAALLAAVLVLAPGLLAGRTLAQPPSRHRAADPDRAALAHGPSCTPAVLNASALLDGAVTVSPMPGAADASPQSQISFLGVPPTALSAVTVTGSRSGAHAGTLEPYSQGDGGSFVPATPFLPGETVSVTAQLTAGGVMAPLRFAFTVGVPDPLSATPERLHRLRPDSLQRFRSRPDLRPPLVIVHASSPAAAPGEVLLAPYGPPAQAGPMMLDQDGGLLWFDPLPRPLVAADVRVQSYLGAPVLTWWQGTISVHGFGLGVDVVMGSHYQAIAVVHAGNGYQADLHDFQITPAGTALLTSYHAVRCDLQARGGGADSAVTDSLLQEIDIRTGLVMFEWTSLDHIPLSASYTTLRGSSPASPYDFFHLNSINLDPDGTLLLSSRNTWAIDDIDAASGRVLWTLGGRHSSFREAAGAATAFQHDARPAGPDAFSVFDNGASPQIHAQSRGVVLAVNARTHTVSVAAQYLHPRGRLLSESQGNMQALAGGDWFIGWGQEPYFSEFSPTGRLLFDASLPAGYESYRVERFAWSATPLRAPALVVAAGPRSQQTAYASWNGASTVAGWEVLEGSSPDLLRAVASAARSGFETAIALHPARDARFVAVAAMDAGGAQIGESAAVALPINGTRAAASGARRARRRRRWRGAA